MAFCSRVYHSFKHAVMVPCIGACALGVSIFEHNFPFFQFLWKEIFVVFSIPFLMATVAHQTLVPIFLGHPVLIMNIKWELRSILIILMLTNIDF